MTDNNDRKPALRDDVDGGTPWYVRVSFLILFCILVGYTYAATRDNHMRLVTGLESCEIIMRDGEHGKFDLTYVWSGDLSYEIKGKFILDPYFADRMEVLYNDKYLSTFLFDNIKTFVDSDSVSVGTIPIVEHTDLIEEIDIITIGILMPSRGL
jgi:hypothetical protein